MEPLVSICCITYNHKEYIRDALDGFLSQRTDFPYEILINDDASTVPRKTAAGNKNTRLFIQLISSNALLFCDLERNW